MLSVRFRQLVLALAVATFATPFSARPAAALVNISVSASQATRTVHPGDADVVLMTIAINNSTLGPRTLSTLRLTNTTTGPGATADLDAELGSVRLYKDNGNGTFAVGEETLVDTRAAAAGAVTFTPS